MIQVGFSSGLDVGGGAERGVNYVCRSGVELAVVGVGKSV